jgi:replicative DNA helicase
MSRDDYFRRILCATFGIPNSLYSDEYMQENLLNLKEEKEKGLKHPIGNIYFKQFGPANTPQDILHWVLQNEKRDGVKIDYVIVDYINLVKSGRSAKQEGTYLSVKQVAEDLRGYGMTHGWVTVTATQTNRAASNKLDRGEAEELTMADTSESFGLPATADAMIGITRTEDRIFCNLILSRRSRYEGNVEFRVDWSTWKMNQVLKENPGVQAFSSLKTNSLL